MKIDPYYQRQKDRSGSVEFTLVYIVHKFTRRVIPNPDFNGTPLFDV